MRPVKLFCLGAVALSAISGARAADVEIGTAAGTVRWTHYDTYISEVRLTRGGSYHGDGYDGAMRVQVSGSVQYEVNLFFSSTYAAAIEHVAVTNPTASAQTYTIRCYGNLGSDSSTRWHYTSSAGPYYTISSDQASSSANGSDPVVSFLYGDISVDSIGTQRSMPFSNGDDDHEFTIQNITIPAGGTQNFLFLGGVGDIDDATYNRPDRARLAVLQLIDPRNWPDDFTDNLTADQLSNIVNWDISADELKITPSEEALFVGYAGGPFVPTNQIYAVHNRTDSTMSWSVSPSADWISVSPAGGTLGRDGIQEVVVGVNEQANTLPAGSHRAVLTFTNTTLLKAYERDITVVAGPMPLPPVPPVNPSPADGAVDVSAGTLLEWEHDSGTVSPSPLVNTTSTYTVYFGTDSNDLAIVTSGLTSRSYDPGILDVDTSYYWQVVASNAVGATTGAVWNFSTWTSGSLDHFDLDIPGHPRMRQPFDVVIQAKDIHGHTVVDYADSVSMQAFRNTTNTTILMRETFEGTDIDDWSLTAGAFQTNDSSFAGNESLFLSTNSCSAYLPHTALQPELVRFAVRSDNASSFSYISLSTAANDPIVYFIMNEDSMYLYTGSGSQSFPFEAGQWYQVAISINWADQLMEWYVDGERMESERPFLEASAINLGSISIYSSEGNQVRFDEMEYQENEVLPVPVAMTPDSTGAFVSGSWTGQVTVMEYVASAFLLATNDAGFSGRSDNFEIDYLGDLATRFPDDVTEGDGLRSGEAEVTVTFPPQSNIVVSLSLAPDAEIEIPATVEIAAGQTNAGFDFTVHDDSELDGSRISTVSIACADYRGSTTSVPVHDNESAVLSIFLPQTTYEGGGVVSGMLEVDRAPDSDVRVELLSDNPDLVPGGYVIVPAGETQVSFSMGIEDNFANGGVQTATITAHVENWTDDRASMFILENEASVLSMYIVPNSVQEDSGTVANQAFVSVSGTASHDLNIRLRSSDPSELSVPDWILVSEGSSMAYFDFEVHDDKETDGAQNISILAEVPGYVSASDSVRVLDDELHHLAVSGLSTNVPVLKPVSIALSARTIDGFPTDAFEGSVALSAVGNRGTIAVEPSVITAFTNGTASASVVFGNIGNEASLRLDAGAGIAGTSSVFNVVGPHMVVTAEPLTNKLVVARGTEVSMLSISNSGNAELVYALTDPSLVAYYPIDGDADDASGNGHDGLVFGASLTEDRFGNLDGAYRFNGVSRYIDVGALGGFQSVSLWIRPGPRTDNDYYFGHNDFRIYASAASSGRLSLGDSGGTITTSVRMDSYVNEWVHVVAISDGANSRVYFNGTLVGSGTLGAVSTNAVNLGRWPGNAHHLNGSLDDVRVYEHVLSEEEILGLYGESELETGLVARYSFNGNALDSSGNDNHATAINVALAADRFGNPGSAYRLKGSSSYVQLPSGIMEDVEECSISGWINLPRRDAWSRIFDIGTGSEVNMFLSPRSNTGTLRFAITTAGYAREERIDAAMPSINQWHHFVVTLGGGVGTLYLDGAVAGQNAGMTMVPADLGVTTRNWIGRSQYATDPYLLGRVDDFRIYNRMLTAPEIEALYTEGVAEPVAEWLTVTPTSGNVPPGGAGMLEVAYCASNRIAGSYADALLRIACNDAATRKAEFPVSMWVLPPAPVMDAEPETTYGVSNTVSWSPVIAPVLYQVEVAESTNSAALQQSNWLSVRTHTFEALAPNTTYYYRARASVSSAIGRLGGPWSDWVWSTQLPIPVDGDGDGIPDWWEMQYFGVTGVVDPNGDSDGDGQSDYDEYVAGMVPTNPASCFMINDASAPTNDQFVIHWDAVTGRVYSIHWTPSLTNTFETMATNILYPQNSYTDGVHQAEASGFYKVEVEMEQD